MDQSSKSQSKKPRSYSDKKIEDASDYIRKHYLKQASTNIKLQSQVDHQQNVIELLLCSTALFAGLAIIELLIILK